MTALLAFSLAVLMIFSLIRQKDIFSPSKFYLLFLTIYFLDVFISDQISYVYLVYSVYLLLGYIFVFIDKGNAISQGSPPPTFELKEGRVLLTIWLLTLVPVLAQLYLIFHFGGLIGYLFSIKTRVLDWHGLGVFLIFKQVTPVVNIIFLVLGIHFKVKSSRWWTLYVIHILLVVLLGALSGSRGATLFGLVNILIARNYFVARVSLKSVFSSIAILLIVAAALGGMRNYQVSEEGFSATELIEKVNFSEVKIFRYGIIPLDMLFEKSDYDDYKYGTTFLSAITIFIPRSIFPDKFKTGGEVLTQFSHGEDYTGTVNYSPGLFVESILNFGYVFGSMFFLIVISSSMVFSIYMRRKFLYLRAIGSVSSIKYFYYYITFAMIPGTFLFAEWTKVIMSTIITLSFFVVIYLFVRLSIDFRPLKLASSKE